MDLKNKVALVTGASRGIGAAIAEALARAGCHVACADRVTRNNPQRIPGTLEDTVERVIDQGVESLGIQVDLADPEQVGEMVRRANSHFGGLDILVNNAALNLMGDLFVDMKRHERVMDVNLRAPMIAIRECVPIFRARGAGSIVNISSVAALYPQPGQLSYGVSKAALERLTVDVANQIQHEAIAVNCFRIDMPIASEGFVANTPGFPRDNWEPCEVVAEGVLWVIQRPVEFSGQLVSMQGLRNSEGIMASRAKVPFSAKVPTTPVTGLLDSENTINWV
ncbi:MAG: SDR family NAD(P)-dependent oxidoreductase [Pseudomonadales bacterium]|nr:SDR family NAD(P)-dependent oxidoreductase [Pseudomonadales bacterium]